MALENSLLKTLSKALAPALPPVTASPCTIRVNSRTAPFLIPAWNAVNPSISPAASAWLSRAGIRASSASRRAANAAFQSPMPWPTARPAIQAPFRLRLISTLMWSLSASTDLRVLADPKAAETSAAFVWFGYRFGGRSGFQSPRIGALAPNRASNSPDSHTGRPMIAE